MLARSRIVPHRPELRPPCRPLDEKSNNFSKREGKLILLACLLLFLAACRSSAPGAAQNSATARGQTLWVTANGWRIKTVIYRSRSLDTHPLLILVLPGDSAFGPTAAQYEFAARAAAGMDNVVAAGILRPGFPDGTGDHSEGVRGIGNGDNYTPHVVDAVAGVAEQLKAKFHPTATILVGHSGGAVIAADILGRWPSAVNAGLLISCPCDITAWRKHMRNVESASLWKRLAGTVAWRLPVGSLSPIELAPRVPSTTLVTMVAGGEDPVAPRQFTERYAAQLRDHGVPVSVVIAPGLGHLILFEPVVFEQLQILVRRLRQ
jgi:predicted esterase